jgi:PAS domain S-box-containing protein
MLRIKLLRNLLIISLAITIFLPGHEFFVVHPAYKKLLTAETESEAVRYASYMVRTLGLENQSLTKDRLPVGLEKSLQPVSRDQQLIKLRIFSAQGEIIFSTKADEIGNINERSYFHEVVAKGLVYSKVVQKDRTTAEGMVAQIDIVETYVPFMVDDVFGGAIEVYYDVTASVNKVKSLSFHSMGTTLVLSLGFLLAISVALYRAYVSFRERAAAEEALRLANEELEQRVDERTQELSLANEQLTGQIAERTLAQVALGQALEDIKVDREKLDGILRSVPDGVVVTDGELNVLHMNAAAEDILDTSLEKVLGHPVGDLSQEVNFAKKIGQRLNIKYGSRFFDVELSGKDGQRSNVYQARISQFVVEENDSPGVVLLLRDVTREREVERMKSAFLGMAAHELNTPLTTIIGYSELLTSKETSGLFDTKQQKSYLELIHNKALALGCLIDDLLDISRVESGRPLTLHYQEFNFDVVVQEIVDSFRKENDQHQFELVLPEAPTPLCADQSRLEQVIKHLVSNAVKYSPGGGGVRVTLALREEKYEVSVADDGIGMNEEQLAHIFDRFYRVDSTDTAVQGVGLGMSIVRNIILAHHGNIQIDSQMGSGTIVYIALPMMPPEGAAESHNPFSADLS